MSDLYLDMKNVLFSPQNAKAMLLTEAEAVSSQRAQPPKQNDGKGVKGDELKVTLPSSPMTPS